MKCFRLLLSLLLASAFTSTNLYSQSLTLEQCQSLARENYPLIKRYSLIEQTTDLSITNLAKGWLPQVSAAAQATLQSDVMTLPDPLLNMLSQQGYDVRGIKKDQYRVALDVNQTIYDGGSITNQKKVARLEGEVQMRQSDVDMYPIRQRVNDIYFGILLLDEKLKLNKELQTLLDGNLDKLSSMLRNGIAMQSDVNTLKAEKLKAEQQQTELETSRKSLCRILGIFIGQEVSGSLEMPAYITVSTENFRPEIDLANAMITLADAREKLLKTRLIPRLSVFAQGYYGYPGYDMFNDMFHHSLSLNGMVGARLVWNIGAAYTMKNDRSLLNVQRQTAETAKETFLFNNAMQQSQRRDGIDKYRRLISQDDDIVELRSQVRRSAESKLTHGIIDANGLLEELTRENQARIDRSTHRILLLKEVYDLKYTVNGQELFKRDSYH